MKIEKDFLRSLVWECMVPGQVNLYAYESITQAAGLDEVVKSEAGHSRQEAELESVVQSTSGSATMGVKPKVTGVMVRGGKAGTGAPCMSVRDIADHFKSISRTKESSTRGTFINTPKRKHKDKTHFGTPRKKAKFKTISEFWKNQPGNLELNSETMADKLSGNKPGSFEDNASLD